MALVDLGALNFTNAVEGTRAFPVTAVPVGITELVAAITRGSLDPAIILSWNIEVSRDGGATWQSWGAAGLTGAGAVFDKHGNLLTESDFSVFLKTPADAQTVMRGSLTNAGARLTTKITIRGDTTPIPQSVVVLDEHHSVTYDSTQNVAASAVSTVTTPSFTITTQPNRIAAIGVVYSANTPTGVTTRCGGVAGAYVDGADSKLLNAVRASLHLVRGPTSGSQTATLTYLETLNMSIGVITAYGVSEFSPGRGSVATGTSATPSITIPTAVGDLTFSCGMTADTFASPTQTQVWRDTVVTGGGGSRGPGTGTSDVHSWSQASAAWSMVGMNITAAPAAPAAVITHDATRFPKFLLRPMARAESV